MPAVRTAGEPVQLVAVVYHGDGALRHAAAAGAVYRLVPVGVEPRGHDRRRVGAAPDQPGRVRLQLVHNVYVFVRPAGDSGEFGNARVWRCDFDGVL